MGIDARMYVVTKNKINEAQVLKLAYEVGKAFGANKFFRYDGRHNISRVMEIEQDGPTIYPKDGEKFLEVHLWTRYYGPDYERGDISFLIMLAEWLERKVPGCTILYGGDSSGVLAEPFGPRERKKMLDHFASDRGREYYDYNLSRGDTVAPTCKLCQVIMTQYGYGPGPANGSFTCYGCDRKLKTNDGGKTFTEVTEKEDL